MQTQYLRSELDAVTLAAMVRFQREVARKDARSVWDALKPAPKPVNNIDGLFSWLAGLRP
jgi:hypothetical protein